MLAAARIARTRQAVARARAAGHVPRPMPAQAPPIAAERAYATRLRSIVDRAITSAYAPLLRSLPTLVASAREERGDAEGWRADGAGSGRAASAAVAAAAKSASAGMAGAKVKAAAVAAAGDASAHVQAQLGKQVREVLGIDLAADTRQRQRTAAFVHENVKLITGVGPTLAADIERIVLSGLTAGQLHETLALAIKSRMQVAINRAELIAVDQLGKIVGQINAARQQDLGVTHFYWRSAEDERVRGNPSGLYPKAVPSHYERNGKRYAYADPPLGRKGERELPGVPIRCRCYPEPDLSELLGDAAVAPTGPVAPSVDDLEAEAARLAAEVEAMLAGPVAAPAPAPAPPTPAATTAGKLKDVRSASDAGQRQVPRHAEGPALRGGKVVAFAMNATQGISASYRVALEYDGARMRAIVKPSSGMRPTRVHADGVAREVAAANAAEVLGVSDMVPATIEVDFPTLGRSSAQAFVESGVGHSDLTPDQVARIDRDAVVRMRVFDVILGNTDRHSGNVMWVDDGAKMKPMLIDNGMALPSEHPTSISQPFIKGAGLNATPLTPGARAAIAGIDTDALASGLAAAGVDLPSIQGALVRAAMVKADPSIVDGGDPNQRRIAGRDPATVLTPEQLADLKAAGQRAFEAAKKDRTP